MKLILYLYCLVGNKFSLVDISPNVTRLEHYTQKFPSVQYQPKRLALLFYLQHFIEIVVQIFHRDSLDDTTHGHEGSVATQ